MKELESKAAEMTAAWDSEKEGYRKLVEKWMKKSQEVGGKVQVNSGDAHSVEMQQEVKDQVTAKSKEILQLKKKHNEELEQASTLFVFFGDVGSCQSEATVRGRDSSVEDKG